MQVKKFEAKTMKDALTMVKLDLGPEAIILSAKDQQSTFGMGGDGTVVVTAAVSQGMLQRKQFAESKLRETDKNQFQNFSAKRQKQFIENVSKNYEEDTHRERRSVTQTPYVDILEDDETTRQQKYFPRETELEASQKRVRGAAERAYSTMVANKDLVGERNIAQPQPQPQAQMPRSMPAVRQRPANPVIQTQEQKPVSVIKQNTPMAPKEPHNPQIVELKNEIHQLKKVIEGFQNVPQSFMSSYPGMDYGLPYELSFAYKKLENAGVLPEFIAEILLEAKEKLNTFQIKKESLVDAFVAQYILNSIQTVDRKNEARIHVFAGTGGEGKTSALVKFASQLVIKENKRIGILSADNQKVGASEQLRIYSQILNVPFGVVKRAEDLESYIQKLSGLDMILVDFPGSSLKEIEEVSHMRSLLSHISEPKSVHYVLSAVSRDENAFEIARRYRMTHYEDVIFTSLDEAVQYGIIYNFQRKFNVPLHSFSIGPKIPEDFEMATKERVLDLLFKLTKISRERTSEEQS